MNLKVYLLTNNVVILCLYCVSDGKISDCSSSLSIYIYCPYLDARIHVIKQVPGFISIVIFTYYAFCEP